MYQSVAVGYGATITIENLHNFFKGDDWDFYEDFVEAYLEVWPTPAWSEGWSYWIDDWSMTTYLLHNDSFLGQAEGKGGWNGAVILDEAKMVTPEIKLETIEQLKKFGVTEFNWLLVGSFG